MHSLVGNLYFKNIFNENYAPLFEDISPIELPNIGREINRVVRLAIGYFTNLALLGIELEPSLERIKDRDWNILPKYLKKHIKKNDQLVTENEKTLILDILNGLEIDFLKEIRYQDFVPKNFLMLKSAFEMSKNNTLIQCPGNESLSIPEVQLNMSPFFQKLEKFKGSITYDQPNYDLIVSTKLSKKALDIYFEAIASCYIDWNMISNDKVVKQKSILKELIFLAMDQESLYEQIDLYTSHLLLLYPSLFLLEWGCSEDIANSIEEELLPFFQLPNTSQAFLIALDSLPVTDFEIIFSSLTTQVLELIFSSKFYIPESLKCKVFDIEKEGFYRGFLALYIDNIELSSKDDWRQFACLYKELENLNRSSNEILYKKLDLYLLALVFIVLKKLSNLNKDAEYCTLLEHFLDYPTDDLSIKKSIEILGLSIAPLLYHHAMDQKDLISLLKGESSILDSSQLIWEKIADGYTPFLPIYLAQYPQLNDLLEMSLNILKSKLLSYKINSTTSALFVKCLNLKYFMYKNEQKWFDAISIVHKLIYQEVDFPEYSVDCFDLALTACQSIDNVKNKMEIDKDKLIEYKEVLFYAVSFCFEQDDFEKILEIASYLKGCAFGASRYGVILASMLVIAWLRTELLFPAKLSVSYINSVKDKVREYLSTRNSIPSHLDTQLWPTGLPSTKFNSYEWVCYGMCIKAAVAYKIETTIDIEESARLFIEDIRAELVNETSLGLVNATKLYLYRKMPNNQHDINVLSIFEELREYVYNKYYLNFKPIDHEFCYLLNEYIYSYGYLAQNEAFLSDEYKVKLDQFLEILYSSKSKKIQSWKQHIKRIVVRLQIFE